MTRREAQEDEAVTTGDDDPVAEPTPAAGELDVDDVRMLLRELRARRLLEP